MDNEELTEFEQVVARILEKKRHPLLTPLTQLEREIYREMLPSLVKRAEEMFREECRKYEERING